MNLSEHSLRMALQRCARKEPAGLQTIITSAGDYFVGYAQCVLRAPQAQQVTRTALSLIWAYAGSYQPQQGPAIGWVFSIFRHCLAKHFQQSLTKSPLQSHPPLQPHQIILNLQQWLTPLAQISWVQACNTLEEIHWQLLLGGYFFALTPTKLAHYLAVPVQQVQKQQQELVTKLVQACGPWDVQDPIWQGQNMQACLSALSPHAQQPALEKRRQTDPAAALDTLRWESLLAQLCLVLTPATLSQKNLTLLQAELGISLPLLHRPSADSPLANMQDKLSANDTAQAAPLKTTRGSHALKPTDSLLDSGAANSLASTAATQTKASTPSISNTDPKADIQSTAPDAPPLARDVNGKAELSNPHKASAEPARRWKLLAIANGLVILGLLTALLWPKAPPINVIKMAPRLGAVLQAPGHSASPGWVLSVDPQGQVLMTPLVETEISPDQRVQLWTQAPNSNNLRSLGLIDPNQPVALTTEMIGVVNVGQVFEMTLESAQQQSTVQPLGPTLFLGRVVNFGHYEADGLQHAGP